MIQSIDPVAFGATLSSAFKFDLIANKPKATVLEALAVDDAMRMLWKQTILPNYVIKLNFFSIFKICNLPWGSLLAKSERLSKSQINRIRTSDRPYQAKRFEANEKKQMRRMNRKLLLGSITKERKFVIRTRRWSAFWKRSMRKQISAHQSNSLQTLRLQSACQKGYCQLDHSGCSVVTNGLLASTSCNAYKWQDNVTVSWCREDLETKRCQNPHRSKPSTAYATWIVDKLEPFATERRLSIGTFAAVSSNAIICLLAGQAVPPVENCSTPPEFDHDRLTQSH